MGEIKRITIPVNENLKDKLELIARGQKRSMSANLEHALEVYAALFDSTGKMLVPIDSILMGDLSSLSNVTKTVQIKNEQNLNDNESVDESVNDKVCDPVDDKQPETNRLQALAQNSQQVDIECEFEC